MNKKITKQRKLKKVGRAILIKDVSLEVNVKDFAKFIEKISTIPAIRKGDTVSIHFAKDKSKIKFIIK